MMEARNLIIHHRHYRRVNGVRHGTIMVRPRGYPHVFQHRERGAAQVVHRLHGQIVQMVEAVINIAGAK